MSTQPLPDQSFAIRGSTVDQLRGLIDTIRQSKSTEIALMGKIKELETQLQSLKKSKRYGLVWEDKPEDVVEQCKKELPVLVSDESKTIEKDPNGPNHILIEGDNFHALSTLAYTHKGKVDVIYIDPPYNTGNKDFSYNDSFVDREDSFRHSKWLSFMHKRLEIAKTLLKDTGVIFISIDDNELSQLKGLCDEIFGEDNLIGQFIVIRAEGGGMAKQMVKGHEYLITYARDSDIFTPLKKPKDIRGKIIQENGIEYWIEEDWLRKEFGKYGTCLYEEIEAIKGLDKKREIDGGIKIGIYRLIPKGENKHIVGRLRRIDEDGSKFYSILKHLSAKGVDDLRKILPGNNFSFPKPLSLLKEIISGATFIKKRGIVLDFFAGSGTTGHAVLELNKEDGGNRQFILCTNNENKIAEEVTYPRIRNVIQGYADVPGIPANLRYYRTDFIGTEKSIDDLRKKFIYRCTDLLQIREGCFKPYAKDRWTDNFQIFESPQKLLAILYNPLEIGHLKSAISREDRPISVYLFSMGVEIFEEELAEYSDRIKFETIPDEILSTYQKIFGF